VLLIQHNIEQKTYLNTSKNENQKTSMGKVERLNRTIREIWERDYTKEDFDEALKKIQEFYNEQRHSVTGMTPNETTTPETIAQAHVIETIRGSEPRTQIKKEYKLGTQVRLREPTDIFKKKSKAKWKKEIHTITKVDGVDFYVSGEGTKKFRAWEMLPIKSVLVKSEQPAIPKEPRIRRGIKQLPEEVQTENILPPEKKRPNPPKPLPSPQPPKKVKEPRDIPEKIISHTWGPKLFFKVRWKDSEAFRKYWGSKTRKWNGFESHSPNNIVSTQPFTAFTDKSKTNQVVADYLVT
jgi:hypothetical protein